MGENATIAAGAMGLAAYGLYFFFDAVYDIGQKAKDVANEIKEAAIEGAQFWKVPTLLLLKNSRPPKI